MYSMSPSRIARYFFHECDRYLLLGSMSKEDKRRLGAFIPEYDHSPVTRAILNSGYDWEKTVIQDKIAGKVRIAPGAARRPIVERVFDVGDSLKQMSSMKPGEYLYQATLKAPKSFYNAHNLDPAKVSFGQCRPDLIERLSGPYKAFRIIDVKASDALKTSHKVQTCLYGLLLEHVLRSESIAGEVEHDRAAIWLYGTDAPDLFDAEPIRLHVMEFLAGELPRIVATDPGEARWHLNYKCEWCEYFEHCRDEVNRTRSVSLIPYLSTSGRDLLRDHGVDTLSDLGKFLERKDVAAILDQSATLGGQQERLAKAVDALTNDRVVKSGGATPVMPKGENIRLVITLQQEPVSGLIYAAALLRTGSNHVFGTDKYSAEQLVASEPDECDEVRREFVTALYSVLSTIDDHNAKQSEWQDKMMLQTYVFDSYEADLLRQLLLDSLSDPLVSEEALSLLFYYQSEDLAVADEHPDDSVEFPLVALTSVARRLLQMPIAVSYQLSSMLEAFAADDEGGRAFTYKAEDYWDFTLSNRLKSDAIFAVWSQGKTEYVDRIKRRLSTRLHATANVVEGIRRHASEAIFAWPPRFALPNSLDFENPVLSRLAFMARYESTMAYLKVRDSRTLTRLERERAAVTVPVVARGGSSFLCTTPAILSLEGSWRMLLTDDSDDGERAQMCFPDYRYRAKPYLPGNAAVAFAQIHDGIRMVGNSYEFDLKVTSGKQSPEVVRGKRYLLHQGFSDYNTDRVIKRLREMDLDGPDFPADVLEDPRAFVGACGSMKGSIRKELEALLRRNERRRRFTKSQLDAFQHIVDNQLTLVWGPPGTGKTYFLALTALTMIEAAAKARKPMRILISAFTHAAIENCLRKVASLRQELGLDDDDCPILKLGAIQTQGCDDVLQVDADRGYSAIDGHERCIVGGTAYSMCKVFKGRPDARPFDCVVVDEGSQVKVPESLLVLSRLSDTGRLVVAGDDKQLPPIINGVYPEPGPGEPLLHRSLFEALREPDRDTDSITCQLIENFRMNDSLCGFSADCLYGADYHSADQQVAERRMSVGTPSRTNASRWAQAVLDPAFPWTMCVLEDVRAGAANWAEAELVSELTHDLRKHLRDEQTGRPFADTRQGDVEFWQRGLFIVSPHHVQIDAIRQQLGERGLREPFFVDTVDKMQGQECEAVIVSYGVADPEYAMLEDEFIYSLNRFNVAVTRAKSKCIVFVPRALLRPSLVVLENPEAAAGAGIMHKLERRAAAGEALEFTVKCTDFPKGTRLSVYRCH